MASRWAGPGAGVASQWAGPGAGVASQWAGQRAGVASVLVGPEAGDILRAALAADGGGQLLEWRAHQVEYRGRAGATAGYRVRLRRPDGTVAVERFGARAGGDPPPPGSLVLGDGSARVVVWRFPHDPYLPGLASAYDPGAVAGLLRSFGVVVGEEPRLLVRAYRPGRRAVVEAVGAGGRLFLKVVLPGRVTALHRRHRLVVGAGVPAPTSLGYTPEGLLLLAPLPGVSMREAMRDPAGPLPTGAEALALLERLPAALAAGPARRSWRDRAGHYASVVAGVLPAEGARARRIATAVGAEGGVGPTVPVHGDFYENQLRVAGGRITGLLDLDTAGPGDRLDDLACLVGHLSVLTLMGGGLATVAGRLECDYLAAFDRAVDPADLRYRAAAVVLSLATGPYRVQQSGWEQATRDRVELAGQWLRSARQRRRP